MILETSSCLCYDGFTILEEHHYCVLTKRSREIYYSILVNSQHIDGWEWYWDDYHHNAYMSSNCVAKGMGEANFLLGVKIFSHVKKKFLICFKWLTIRKFWTISNAKMVNNYPIEKEDALCLNMFVKISKEK